MDFGYLCLSLVLSAAGWVTSRLHKELDPDRKLGVTVEVTVGAVAGAILAAGLMILGIFSSDVGLEVCNWLIPAAIVGAVGGAVVGALIGVIDQTPPRPRVRRTNRTPARSPEGQLYRRPYHTWIRNPASQDWPTTAGNVSRSEHEPSSDNPAPLVEVAYTVGSTSYTVSGIEPTDDNWNLTTEEVLGRYPLGKQVAVRYNPDNPQQAFIVG